MAATNANVDPSQTTDDITSQPLMKIQSTIRVQSDVTQYPEELQILIVALQNSSLSMAMFSSFSMPMTWLSLASSTAVYSKTMKVVTFQLINDKKFKLTMKLFAQILNIPTVERFYEVSNEQVLHMFNEMGYQQVLTKISGLKKFYLPCIWYFLYGIYLRCLTGRSVGLDKAELEIYALIMKLSCGRNF